MIIVAPRLTLAALGRRMTFAATLIAGALSLAPAQAQPTAFEPGGALDGVTLIEPPSLKAQIDSGVLPRAAERLPQEPLVVDLAENGREFGRHGGVWRMMINKAKAVRYGVVYGYARLVGYSPTLRLQPDILKSVDVKQGRIFTMTLRKGHKWSDGHPFTSEDFRYWWEDVANNEELSPGGPPELLLVHGEPPKVSFPDETTVIYEWAAPNPMFLSKLAGARPPFIYRPAHYLKPFHAKYADPYDLADKIAKAHARSWAALHNSVDNLYKSDNPDLPSLQPWFMALDHTGRRFVWKRNPFFHRVDAKGRQLPYIDTIEMTVASSGLIPAKTNAGEADLQAIGLGFSDTAVLKRGEETSGYRTYLWKNGAASQIALYPNLNYGDPVWRELLRDARFRRALSLGISRRLVNRSLYFGLATESANALLEESPLFNAAYQKTWSDFDPDHANALLDELGLTERDGDGVRLLPDGRRLEVIVATSGERPEESDALELVAYTWREIGVDLIQRPLDRDILRNRVYSGAAMMSVWYGWDNGLAGPDDPPEMLAPMRQDSLQWPKWGQYYETHGEAGEAPDTPEGERLMELGKAWTETTDTEQRRVIWDEMLAIHANQLFIIGLVSETPQPIVVSTRMRNVPESGIWSWEPGSFFGVYRPDEFFFEQDGGSETAALGAN